MKIWKRITSMVTAAVMAFGLIQLSANVNVTAVMDENEVKGGGPALYSNGVLNTTDERSKDGLLPGDLWLSKTAAITSEPNVFEITLEVKGGSDAPEMTAGVVTDPMGENVTFLSNSIIGDNANANYDSDSIIWQPSSLIYGSSITYKVKLDVEVESFDIDEFHLLNKRTTFDYSYNGEDYTADFNVPSAKGIAGNLYATGYLVNSSGSYLNAETFQVTNNKAEAAIYSNRDLISVSGENQWDFREITAASIDDQVLAIESLLGSYTRESAIIDTVELTDTDREGTFEYLYVLNDELEENYVTVTFVVENGVLGGTYLGAESKTDTTLVYKVLKGEPFPAGAPTDGTNITADEGYKKDGVYWDPDIRPDVVTENLEYYFVCAKDVTKTKEVDYAVKYYVDGIEMTDDEVKVTNNVWVNDPDEIILKPFDETPDKYPGYKYEKTEPDNLTPGDIIPSGSIIEVYYVKDSSQTKEVDYTVKYYVDGIEMTDDKVKVTENIWVNDPDEITLREFDKSNDKYPGYKYEKTEPDNLTTGEKISSGSIIEVYYVKDLGQVKSVDYTVRYFKDNVEVTEDIIREYGSVWVNDPDKITLKPFDESNDRYPGYYYQKTQPNSYTPGDEIPSGTIIDVYYVSRTDLIYTVKYYQDSYESGYMSGKDETVGGQTYGDTVSISMDTALINKNKPSGYNNGTVKPSELVIDYDEENNIFHVLYVKQAAVPTVNKTVRKIWADENNADSLRPNAISVQLYANGSAYGNELVLTAGKDWTYTWESLPEFDDKGNKIVYTVKEVNVPAGYFVRYSADTFVITNTHVPAPSEPEVILYINKLLRDPQQNLVGDGRTFKVQIIDSSKNLVREIDLSANGDPVIVRGLKSGEVYTIGELSSTTFDFKGFNINGEGLIEKTFLTFRVTLQSENTAGVVHITLNNEMELIYIDDENPPLTLPDWPDELEIIEIEAEEIPLSNGSVPVTGDTNDVPGYIAILTLAGAIAFVLVRRRRKNEK